MSDFASGVLYVTGMLRQIAKHTNPELNYTEDQRQAIADVLNTIANSLEQVFREKPNALPLNPPLV